MPEIDMKTLAVIALVVGLIAGAALDNQILTKPRIEELTETINEKDVTIGNLENQINTLESENEDLEQDYEELNTAYEDALDEIEGLEEEMILLSQSLNTAEETISNIEVQLENIENEYNELLIEYYEIYNPIVIEYTINNLNIKLTTTLDIYPENTDISGIVEIEYTDGSQFIGSLTLNLEKVYQPVRTTSDPYEMQTQDLGQIEYTWTSPFILGQGSYKLTLSELKDRFGTTIALGSELRKQGLYIFVG